MTFEESLDRLKERHEALTQTVEHLALQDEEQRKLNAETSRNIDRVLTIVERLAQVVQSHEHRISGLEGGLA